MLALRLLVPWLAIVCCPLPGVAQPKPLDKVTVRLDWINSGYHAVWYHARDRGIFAEHGIDLEVLEAKGLPVATLSIAEAGINVPGLAIITNRDLIAKNPDLVRRFVAAWPKALDAVQKDPAAAMDALMKRAPTLDRAAHSRILELSFPLFHSEASRGKPVGWTPPVDIEKAQEILIPFGAVKNRQPIETYFTNEFVPGA